MGRNTRKTPPHPTSREKKGRKQEEKKEWEREKRRKSCFSPLRLPTSEDTDTA
ncbi:hypothetical protein ACLOJK_030084, partial [Asimina triloba]